MLKLTIWMNHPSHYQDDLFCALARCAAVDLQVVFAEEVTAHRRNLGFRRWNTDFPSRFLRRPIVWDAVRAAWRQRDRWHIVNGIWAESAFAAALVVLRLFARGRFVIYSESEDITVARGIAKQALRRTFGRWIARGAAGVLAISGMSERFYRGIGFTPDQVYRFGYFQSGDVAASDRFPGDPSRTEIVFAGQFIRRKGIDLLLEALSPLWVAHPDLHLSLIGGGPDEPVLRSAVAAAGVADRVTFAGVLPADEMRPRIAAADLFVLPSRFDGWGFVVNEALSVGVPVLVSDRCGAAELVRHAVNGYVFRSESVADLRACLEAFLRNRGGRESMRSASREMGARISTQVVVPYLIDCLDHMADPHRPRPTAPWLDPSAGGGAGPDRQNLAIVAT